MANAWGELTWNAGLWGQQADAIVALDSFGLTTSQGQANFTPVDGWGRNNWGALGWGVNFANDTFTASGYSLNLIEGDVVVSGEINEGWGRLTWGENAWGGTGDVILQGFQLNISEGTVDASPDAMVTGQQINTSLGDIYAFGLAVVFPTGLQLNISEGTADAEPDAEITGQQINTSLNSVTITAEINSGWGRLGWGIYDWGSDGLSVITSVTGQQLNITQGEESSSADVDVSVFSTIDAGWGQVAWGTQNWGQGELTVNLNIAEGEVDPSPDATVTGIGMTVSLAVGTVVIGTGNVTLTGEQINIAQGTVEAIPNTIASVTGIGLNIAVGTVFAGGTSVIIPTGNGLTIALNSINNQIWTEINTGTDATWIEIDTAA
jgi:hypothetical protein